MPEKVELEIKTAPLACIAPPAVPVPFEILFETVELKMFIVEVEKFCIPPPELVEVLFETVQPFKVIVAAPVALFMPPPFAAAAAAAEVDCDGDGDGAIGSSACCDAIVTTPRAESPIAATL